VELQGLKSGDSVRGKRGGEKAGETRKTGKNSENEAYSKG
jgi:hypothetical protein